MLIFGYFLEALLFFTLAVVMTIKVVFVWRRRDSLRSLPFDFYGAVVLALVGLAAMLIHVNKFLTHIS